MAINYKLNFCRITLASNLFVRNNYFPLFRILTPADATKELIKNSFTPKNHYMPVLLSHKKRERLSRGKKLKDLKNYGKRLHSKIDEFQYMTVCLCQTDEKHNKLQEVLKTKRRIRGHFVYKVEERNTCLVFDGQLEEAARVGDIVDVTIADNTNKMIMKLRTGEKLTAEVTSFEKEDKLFEGEAATTKDQESRHHYGKTIMTIAHIFEMKERSAALYELEKLQFKAKKRQRVEREWKDGLEPLLGNLNWDNPTKESNKELTEIEKTDIKMNIKDMSKTLNVSSKLMKTDLTYKLPMIKEINKMVKKLSEGNFIEIEEMTGVLIKMGDDVERFIVGQIVETEIEKVFVPGQTFETTTGVKYIPGITVNLDNIPTFVAGVILADECNNGVFLPGQTVITQEGKMKLPKEGERITPVGMKKLQMTEDEQWERVERRKMAKEKLEKEKFEKKQLAEKKRALKKENRKRIEAARLKKIEQESKLEEPTEKMLTTDDKNLVTVEKPVENVIVVSIKDKPNSIDQTTITTTTVPVSIIEKPIKNTPVSIVEISKTVETPKKSVVEVEDHVVIQNTAEVADDKVCTSNKIIGDFSTSPQLHQNTDAQERSRTDPEVENTDHLDRLLTDPDKMSNEEYVPVQPVEESETLKQFNEEIVKGIFLQDHSHLVDAETIDRDREMMKAKCLKAKQEEERKKNAVVADNMKDVIEALELKKTKLLEKLRNIQNETVLFEDKQVTYIYPAKANAVTVEMGFDGQPARNIAKILLGITRWANTFSAKFHVHSENINFISYSSEIDEGFRDCSDTLKSVLKAAMVAAVEIFKLRPQDLEAGLRAAAQIICEAAHEYDMSIIDEISTVLENKTNSERNVLFSSTLKDLTKKIVVNKAETLRSVIREEYNEEKIVSKVNLVIEEEGDILVRAFTNLAVNNEVLVKKVYGSIVNTASELICEERAGEMAHRAIVEVVQEIYDDQLNHFLRTESSHSIKHLLSEAQSLAEIIGMKNEAKTIDRLIREEDEDCVSAHALATDQVTLDILRRVIIMRELADRNPYLKTGLKILRRDHRKSGNDKNVRELVRESASLISHACPILTSLDIPSFLFELGNNMAMEDYLVQRIKKDGALLISKKGIQAVVPKEASRFVLSGLISYTLIDDKGVTYFKPMHVFNALKLGKQQEKMYYDYSCVGAFDKYAYSVPVRESLDYNYRNYQAHSNCRDDLCCATGGGDWDCCWVHLQEKSKKANRKQHSSGGEKESKRSMMTGAAVGLAGPRT